MTRSPYVQKGGSADFALEYSGAPQEFTFLLMPKTTMLALASAIEPLRIANQLTRHQLYTWQTMTEDGEPIRCSNGLRIIPDRPMAPLSSNAMGFVCAGVEPDRSVSPAVLNWIRREYRFGRSLGGICTGSFALAAAGILTDKRFTLHWENHQGFSEAYPDLTPTQNLFEVDGRITTCGGGNAAIDMMLALIEQRHGPDLAIMVADMCIHMRSGRNVPQRSAYSVAIGSRNPKLLAALQIMNECIEDPLTSTEICARLGLSRRQLERLFGRYLGEAPMNHYMNLRLSRACALLNETNLNVTEIAAATGFSNTSHLARKFREKYGTSPHAYRKRWS